MTRILRRSPPAAPVTQPATSTYKPDHEEEGGSKVDYPAVIARYKAKVTNRASAIRAKCVECSGGMLSEVRECKIVACALHPYRLGTDPNNKKTKARLERESQSNTDEGDEE